MSAVTDQQENLSRVQNENLNTTQTNTTSQTTGGSNKQSNQSGKISKIESWINWFNSQESSDIVNKSHQEALFKTFDASI